MRHAYELSQEQQLREVARMFAAGLLRLRQRRLLAGAPASSFLDRTGNLAANALEVPRETVLSVTDGLTVSRVPDTRSTKW